MNTSDLDNISLAQLAERAPLYLYWVTVSPFCFLANLLVILTISLSKQLQNKSQFIILGHSVAELLFSLAYFGTGLKRYLPYVLHTPVTTSQLYCIFEQTPFNFGVFAVKIMSLSLALDRLLCICAPIFYRGARMGTYVLTVNVCCWTYVLTMTTLGFVYYDPQKRIPMCYFYGAYDAWYISINNKVQNAATVITVALYVFAALTLWRQYKRANLLDARQKSEWRRHVELDVFVAIAVVGAIYVIGSGIPSVITVLVSQYPSLGFINLTPIDTTVAFISSISHFLVYLKINRVFRSCFMRLFSKHDDNVVVNILIK